MKQDFVRVRLRSRALIERHLREAWEAWGARHPEAGWGVVKVASPSLRVAVCASRELAQWRSVAVAGRAAGQAAEGPAKGGWRSQSADSDSMRPLSRRS
jgi:hypothetical protein